MSVDVLPDGSAGPSWWPPLVERVWSESDWPGATSRDVKPRRADAAWLLAWVFERRDGAPERFELLRFLQRRFSGASPEALHAIEIALHCRKDMPALALSLERIGVTDAGVLTAVSLAAHTLTGAGDRDVVTPALLRWQSALGLLEQARRRGVLPVPAMNAMLQSLAAMTPADFEKPAGQFGAWMVNRLLPAIVSEPAPPDEVDEQVVAALSGSGVSRARISWEGLDYVVDPAGPIEKTAWAIRRATAGPRVRDLITLQEARRVLDGGSLTIDDVRMVAKTLAEIEPVITARPVPAVGGAFDDFTRLSLSSARSIGRPMCLEPDARCLPSCGRSICRPNASPARSSTRSRSRRRRNRRRCLLRRGTSTPWRPIRWTRSPSPTRGRNHGRTSRGNCRRLSRGAKAARSCADRYSAWTWRSATRRFRPRS